MALLRRGLGALEVVAPPLAAWLTGELFLTPRRISATEEERSAFAGAERFQIRFAGQRLAGWRWGDGPTVLLVHGWAGRATQLHAFARPLVEAGLGVVAFDAPGHGDSTGWYASLPELALAIARVAELGPIHGLLAHSMGAAAAGLAIADGLSVGRAVFVAPPADALVYFRRFAGALGISEPVERAARRRIEERLLVPWTRLSAERVGPRLDLPLLVIHDRGDRQVPWVDGALTVDASPRSQLLTTEGLGHRRILRDPTVVSRAVGFLAEGIARAPSERDALERELFERDRRHPRAA